MGLYACLENVKSAKDVFFKKLKKKQIYRPFCDVLTMKSK